VTNYPKWKKFGGVCVVSRFFNILKTATGVFFLYIPKKKLKKYFSEKSRVCVSFFQNALSYYVMTGGIFQYTKQKNDIDITHFGV